MKKVLKIITDNYITFCIYALIGWIYEVTLILIREHIFENRGVLFGPFLPIYGFGGLILLLLLKKFMNKKHLLKNPLYLIISIATITTFILVTLIEYTTPKIYRVDYFLQNYGIYLLIANLVTISLTYYLTKKSSNKIKNIDTTIVIVFLLIWIITTVIEYVSHYFIDVYSHKMLWDYSKDFLNINKRVNWDASRNFAIGGTVLLYTVQPLINKYLNKSKINTKITITLIIGIPMIIDFIINVVLK